MKTKLNGALYALSVHRELSATSATGQRLPPARWLATEIAPADILPPVFLQILTCYRYVLVFIYDLAQKLSKMVACMHVSVACNVGATSATRRRLPGALKSRIPPPSPSFFLVLKFLR